MATWWRILLLSFLLSIPAAAVDDGADRASLLDFKKGITRDPLRILSSWNQTIHICEWEGVTCGHNHNSKRVTALDLSSRGLLGSISPSIGNLTFLATLQLSINALVAEIPKELGRLRRLQQLNLSSNSLHGGIPVNLTYCSKLRVVDLNNNQLTGEILIELGSLSELHSLALRNNSITGSIPTSLGNLSALAMLDFSINHLEGGIPDEMGRLSNLQEIVVSFNNLTGEIPSSIFNLSRLYKINLGFNKLQGVLPRSIGNTLPNLQSLYLSGNYFSGSIPASLTNASGMLRIILNTNDFVGRVPPDLGKLQHLQKLNLIENRLEARDEAGWEFFTSLTNCSLLDEVDLSKNDLGGLLPSSIANFSSRLRNLEMSDNQIAGRIDPGIDNLVGLVALALYDNLLTGPIPPGIGKLGNLYWLGLHYNRLTGPIPTFIGNLTKLGYLGFSYNNLEGPIPPSIGNLQQLMTLALSNNNLNGTIPEEITTLASLSYVLNLANNSLVGPLPMKIGSLSKLAAFYVSDNQLIGEIPAGISDCQSLEYLSLDNNLFQGTIPQSLGRVRGLRILDISHNNLSGQIPVSLENLNALDILDLSFNHLEGQVPMRGVFGNTSLLSLIGNDGLCGGIRDLNLTSCSERLTTGREEQSRVLKIVIPIVGGILCLVILLFCIPYYLQRRRKLRKPKPTAPLLEEQYQRVSYDELAKATNGFSSENIVGSGSYGSVYKGSLDGGSTIVAVKVFNLEQQGATKSFIAECEALRTIRHRNLVKILTSCSSIDSKGDDFKALVFEFMPNGSLDIFLHGGGDDDQLTKHGLLQRLNIAIDVADALEYLHHDCQPPVIHCDLKPSNVLIDEEMSGRVGDFGLARLIPEAVSRSLQGSAASAGIKGSIGYIAPEYGTGCEVSIYGDAYSFGILLLEMITGRRPVDDMFTDGLSLHGFVKMAFPDRIMEIVDPRALLREDDSTNTPRDEDSIRECLNSLLRIGLSCSKQSPRERMSMRNANAELRGVRQNQEQVP